MSHQQRPGVIFWDFDRTLAHRAETWAGTLLAVLLEHDPACDITREQVAPFLRSRFPWHAPEIAHPELCEPEAWWRSIEALMAEACAGLGHGSDTAAVLARRARHRYLDPAGWSVYEDVTPVLSHLREHGWRHAIISNHVPELAELVRQLGLAPFFESVISSAVAGYEKPNSVIYRAALEAAGRPRSAWMVGDNYGADVLGAERAGLRAILVRTQDERARRACANLYGVPAIIAGGR